MSQASPENRHPENQAAMSEEDLAALRQLHRMIDEEMRKPLEEQDEELISECIGTIAEIKGVKGSFSAEEIDEQIAIVKAKAAQEKAARRPKRIRKPVLIAACAALLVAVSMITAYANPTLRAWLTQLRQGGIGATAEEHGVTYEYMGESVIYNNVEELLAAEGIDIYYPAELPEVIYIKRILCIDFNDAKVYSIKFNTTDISVRVQTKVVSSLNATPTHEIYSTPIGEFIIYTDESLNVSTAKGILAGSQYNITVKNGLNIKEILNSLKESSK